MKTKTPPKKVALSANTSWYLYNFRKNTVIKLIESGYVVYAVSPNDKYSRKLIELGLIHIPVYIDQSGMNPIKDFITFLHFLRIYIRIRPNVILNFTPKNNIYGTFAAFFSRSKCINNISGLGKTFVNTTLIARLVRFLYKISQNFAYKVFFQNEEDRKLFLNYKLVKSSVTEKIPGSGVDLNRFVHSPSKDDGVVRFVLVARLIYEKGIIEYVEAARQLKKNYGDEIEFRIVGFTCPEKVNGVKDDELLSWVNSGLIKYMGPSDKVEIELEDIDCLVLPSFYREGVPKSLLEGAAMGKPIITTDNIGCRDAVDHNITGYLCKPKCKVDLKKYIEIVFNMSHSQRLEMGRLGRLKVINEFNEEQIIVKYMDAILQVN